MWEGARRIRKVRHMEPFQKRKAYEERGEEKGLVRVPMEIIYFINVTKVLCCQKQKQTMQL